MRPIIGIILLVICMIFDIVIFVKSEKNKKDMAFFIGLVVCEVLAIICWVLQLL